MKFHIFPMMKRKPCASYVGEYLPILHCLKLFLKHNLEKIELQSHFSCRKFPANCLMLAPAVFLCCTALGSELSHCYTNGQDDYANNELWPNLVLFLLYEWQTDGPSEIEFCQMRIGNL